MAAKRELRRDEFEAVTERLITRARSGRGRIQLVPTGDLEDVAQDAWEKLIRQAKDLPRGAALEAYAHQALVDTSIDYLRLRRRKKAIPVDKLVPLHDAPEEQLASDETDEQRLAAIQARDLYERLSEITDESATAYAVLDALGLHGKEIATKLGMSEHEAEAARKRVYRARLAIGEAVTGLPTTEEDL